MATDSLVQQGKLVHTCAIRLGTIAATALTNLLISICTRILVPLHRVHSIVINSCGCVQTETCAAFDLATLQPNSFRVFGSQRNCTMFLLKTSAMTVHVATSAMLGACAGLHNHVPAQCGRRRIHKLAGAKWAAGPTRCMVAHNVRY